MIDKFPPLSKLYNTISCHLLTTHSVFPFPSALALVVWLASIFGDVAVISVTGGNDVMALARTVRYFPCPHHTRIRPIENLILLLHLVCVHPVLISIAGY